MLLQFVISHVIAIALLTEPETETPSPAFVALEKTYAGTLYVPYLPITHITQSLWRPNVWARLSTRPGAELLRSFLNRHYQPNQSDALSVLIIDYRRGRVSYKKASDRHALLSGEQPAWTKAEVEAVASLVDEFLQEIQAMYGTIAALKSRPMTPNEAIARVQEHLDSPFAAEALVPELLLEFGKYVDSHSAELDDIRREDKDLWEELNRLRNLEVRRQLRVLDKQLDKQDGFDPRKTRRLERLKPDLSGFE